MKYLYRSDSSEQTEAFASKMGQHLRGGECIELSSDLGGGKTTFTRGLAAGMGSTDQVSSPTFTINKQYSAHDMTLYHYDFYRLQEAGLVAEELAESISDPQAVLVIEWAQSVDHVLPEDRVIITIKRTEHDENARVLHINVPKTKDYLFIDMKDTLEEAK